MTPELLDKIWAILCRHANGPENKKPLSWIVDVINRSLFSPDVPGYKVKFFQTTIKPSLLNTKRIVGTHPRGVYACTTRSQAQPTFDWFETRQKAIATNLGKIRVALEELPA